MSIVLELQKQAIRSDADVASLLRTALVIARKLEIEDFQKWVEDELNGYEFGSKIPEYRYVRGVIKGWNGLKWVDVKFDTDKIEKKFTRRPIDISITKIKTIKNELTSVEDRFFTMNYSSEVNKMLCDAVKDDALFALHIPIYMIVDIVEQVKNKILEWCLLLEENGILGNEISFSNEEKQKVQTNQSINNYITNIYAPTNDLQLQMGTSNSNQQNSTNHHETL